MEVSRCWASECRGKSPQSCSLDKIRSSLMDLIMKQLGCPSSLGVKLGLAESTLRNDSHISRFHQADLLLQGLLKNYQAFGRSCTRNSPMNPASFLLPLLLRQNVILGPNKQDAPPLAIRAGQHGDLIAGSHGSLDFHCVCGDVSSGFPMKSWM